jgi:LacI family transcriptional regulator, galactose operon repressor
VDHHPVTLKDVAREAGVHSSTASRALNVETRSVVSRDTVERVLSAANRLGYRPHPLARGLRTNRTMTVGMVIPDIQNPLFGPIIAGVESRLGEEGYSLLIADAGHSDEYTHGVVDSLLERRVDGLILATAARSDEFLDDLAARVNAIVLVNRTTEGTPLPAVVTDDHAGIGLAVDHLVKLGHERIGHVAGPRSLSTGVGRYQAFIGWMHSFGLEAAQDVIEEASWFQVTPGYEAATKLLGRRPDLTAIVGGNDLLALGAYTAVREIGKEVGVDVSITGYNDVPLLDLLQPPLTSVRVPYRQMGTEAATMLMARLRGTGRTGMPVSVRLRPTLVVRGSTAPPP